MFRRNFLQSVTLAATSGIAAIRTTEAGEQKTVTYRIKGFTCITCATGLEVILCREKGVTAAKASYPDATAVITFDPKSMAETKLKGLIAEMGFTVEELG
jgi:copper chaperone CopZ